MKWEFTSTTPSVGIKKSTNQLIKVGHAAFESVGDTVQEDAFLETAFKLVGGLSKELLGKRYLTPDNYWNPLKVTNSLADALFVSHVNKECPTENQARCLYAGLRLQEHDCPVFWLSPPLLQALERTNLPNDFSLQDVHFPHNAMVMMFPYGFMTDPSGLDVGAITICKTEKGVRVRGRDNWNKFCPYSDMCMDRDGLLSIIHAGSHRTLYPATDDEISKNPIYFMNLPTDTKESIQEQLEGKLNSVVDSLKLEEGKVVFSQDNKLSESDDEFTRRAYVLAVKVLLFISSHSEQVERWSPTMARKPKRKGKRVLEALWSPHVIGHDYKMKEKSGGPSSPSGVHIRAHWKCGHYKMQPYGKNRLQRKLIWIEPYCTHEP